MGREGARARATPRSRHCPSRRRAGRGAVARRSGRLGATVPHRRGTRRIPSADSVGRVRSGPSGSCAPRHWDARHASDSRLGGTSLVADHTFSRLGISRGELVSPRLPRHPPRACGPRRSAYPSSCPPVRYPHEEERPRDGSMGTGRRSPHVTRSSRRPDSTPRRISIAIRRPVLIGRRQRLFPYGWPTDKWTFVPPPIRGATS